MKSLHETSPSAIHLAPCAWESFLDRAPLALDRAQASASLQGKRILITGAGGWIGSALTRGIAEFAPKQLVLLEAAERNLYEIDTALRQLPCPIEHVSVLGSVSQPALLAEIFTPLPAPDRLSRSRFQACSPDGAESLCGDREQFDRHAPAGARLPAQR